MLQTYHKYPGPINDKGDQYCTKSLLLSLI